MSTETLQAPQDSEIDLSPELAVPERSKVGRPAKVTITEAMEIFTEIARGRPAAWACAQRNINESTFFKRVERNPQFASLYAQARGDFAESAQAQMHAEPKGHRGLEFTLRYHAPYREHFHEEIQVDHLVSGSISISVSDAEAQRIRSLMSAKPVLDVTQESAQLTVK